MKYIFLLYTYVLPERLGEKKKVTLKFEVYMVLTAKNMVFYNLTLCSVTKVYGCFREASCCHHQGRWITYSRHTHLSWWKRLQDPWTICHPIWRDISLHNVDYIKTIVCLSSVCRRTDTILFRHSNDTAKRYILHSLKDIYSPLWQRYNKFQTSMSSWRRYWSLSQKTPPPSLLLTMSLTCHMILRQKQSWLFRVPLIKIERTCHCVDELGKNSLQTMSGGSYKMKWWTTRVLNLWFGLANLYMLESEGHSANTWAYDISGAWS